MYNIALLILTETNTMLRQFHKVIWYNLCYVSRKHSTEVYRPAIDNIKKMFKSAVFNLQEATADQVKEFLNSFDTVLSDCDGKCSRKYLLTTNNIFCSSLCSKEVNSIATLN